MRWQLRALSRLRPRILTLVVLLLIAVPTVLSNLTSEFAVAPQPNPLGRSHIQRQYGWPLVWHWYNLRLTPATVNLTGSEYSGVRLATNLAIWLLILAAPTCICEWSLRRYQPRLRWSLRTMLVAVAVIAVVCAWFTAASKRAGLQDSLIARMRARSESIWVKRGAPRWVGFLGVDRYFRRIARANVRVGYRDQEADDDLEILDSLLRLPELQSLDLEALHITPAIAEKLKGVRLPNLRSLYLNVDRLTPDIIAGVRKLPRLRALGLSAYEASPRATKALADLQQLRAISIRCERFGDDERMCRLFLEAAGKVTALESLSLSDATIRGDGLACLSGLANLKRLDLDSAVADEQSPLARLPLLPRLESLDVGRSNVTEDDVRQLAAQPRLKALNLAFTNITGAGVAGLGSCESLEELVVDRGAISIAALQSLMAIKRLKALHIPREAILGKSALQQSDRDAARRRVFDALRQAKPGIVIDSGSTLTTVPDGFEVWRDPGGGLAIGGEFELAR